MRILKPLVLVAASLTALFASLVILSPTLVAQERVLYKFQGPNANADGGEPWGKLLHDQAGNLYGTTADEYGGNGTVYELSPTAGGGWRKSILYRFQGGADGWVPTSGLIFDSLGNLYGTTGQGGLYGFGTVYELTPSGGGWTKTILHSFDGYDGQYPVSNLTFDSSGNLWGMTPFGGVGCTSGCGVIFELTNSGGAWQENVIHYFLGNDGYNPTGYLVLDAQGNFYGTVNAAGSDDSDGFVFQLHPTGSGWSYNILHTFYNIPPKCSGGSFAGAPPTPVLDAAGNLYGPALAGGDQYCNFGVIWKLSPLNGQWNLSVLYRFTTELNGNPLGDLTLDKQGNLYGVSVDLANGPTNLGTVFKLSPNSTGRFWTHTVLHHFQGLQVGDGDTPVLAPIFNQDGNLYGTTLYGGYGGGEFCAAFYGCGVVYGVKP